MIAEAPLAGARLETTRMIVTPAAVEKKPPLRGRDLKPLRESHLSSIPFEAPLAGARLETTRRWYKSGSSMRSPPCGGET